MNPNTTPLNHLRSKLDRLCNRYRFLGRPGEDGGCMFEMENTRRRYSVGVYPSGRWYANEVDQHRGCVPCEWMAGILNGDRRNDAGDMVAAGAANG